MLLMTRWSFSLTHAIGLNCYITPILTENLGLRAQTPALGFVVFVYSRKGRDPPSKSKLLQCYASNRRQDGVDILIVVNLP